MPRVWMSHGTHVQESWHTYVCVMQRVCMSHGPRMNESFHTQHSIGTESRHTQHLSRTSSLRQSWFGIGAILHESLHTYECVESWHTYEWVMAHIWITHGPHNLQRGLSHLHTIYVYIDFKRSFSNLQNPSKNIKTLVLGISELSFYSPNPNVPSPWPIAFHTSVCRRILETRPPSHTSVCWRILETRSTQHW
jgi:hypothetical protein